ncbi:SCP2 sterol-binding domain-containing protein [Pajaroellobacter abortibovis]|uniref:SCP2 sterol-binding domain-containing protein n=1 Tax=Pajaroellobacter abortibovis TaxID=1882918 RepID=UPI0012EB4A7E|nr:SCP2 sterol-binding domain-containing protein [Pajaroellobacter abortibovis]
MRIETEHLDVEHGKCRSCLLVKADEVHDASFVIVGAYAQWKQMVERALDPMRAML